MAAGGRWIVGVGALSCGPEIRGEPRQLAGPQGSHPPTLTLGHASRNPPHFLLPLPPCSFWIFGPIQALERKAAGVDQ